ncbi:hypothetical protein HPB47_022838 [Ixodes persulcatus]|uniref:Uncharacterized protein n=1 Tax=Ixodes persulcatus TaxID=34615 RepID=A0AC60QAZ4_IXOPE|nr:hypothetical protein HPB47_022838 [Ixodes persulcatus]
MSSVLGGHGVGGVACSPSSRCGGVVVVCGHWLASCFALVLCRSQVPLSCTKKNTDAAPATYDPARVADRTWLARHAVPRSFNKCKIEAYRASTLASSRQVARSKKFISEAYVDPASVQVLRSTTGVLIKASCFTSQRKAKHPRYIITDSQDACRAYLCGLICPEVHHILDTYQPRERKRTNSVIGTPSHTETEVRGNARAHHLAREEAEEGEQVKWRLLQTNTYPTPPRINLLYPQLYPSPTCPNCQQDRGTIYHMVLDCPKHQKPEGAVRLQNLLNSWETAIRASDAED